MTSVAPRQPLTVLVDRLGVERAARVIDEAGGERLVIPPTLDHGDAPRPLEVRFGRELAILLVLHFGGESVYVPNGQPAGGARRIQLADVVRLTRDRLSAAAIARELKCSDRVVYMRRAEARSLGLLPEQWLSPSQVGHIHPRR